MSGKGHVVEEHGEGKLRTAFDLQAVHEVDELFEDRFNAFSVFLVFDLKF